jgi:hypothetical protein
MQDGHMLVEPPSTRQNLIKGNVMEEMMQSEETGLASEFLFGSCNICLPNSEPVFYQEITFIEILGIGAILYVGKSFEHEAQSSPSEGCGLLMVLGSFHPHASRRYHRAARSVNGAMEVFRITETLPINERA